MKYILIIIPNLQTRKMRCGESKYVFWIPPQMVQQGLKPVEETTKPKNKKKGINYWALYYGLESSIIVLNYHNNVMNDYYIMILAREVRKLAQSHTNKHQPSRNLFLQGVNTNKMNWHNYVHVWETWKYSKISKEGTSNPRDMLVRLPKRSSWAKASCVHLGQTKRTGGRHCSWLSLFTVLAIFLFLYCKCLLFYKILALVLTKSHFQSLLFL